MAIGLVMLVGMCGYMWIEGWGFWHALYFTVITMTTVGFGDYGLSEMGQRFTTFLLIGGLGVVTYSIGQIFPVVFNNRIVREWKMQQHIHKLSDHFIVCGLGRVGRAVCASLADARVPFVAVDPNHEMVEHANDLGYLATVGDAASDETLLYAGIERAKGIACLTGCDTENIVITLSARQLSPDILIVSRAELQSAAQKMRRAGASRVILPIRAGGASIANILVKPHLSELFEQAQTREGGIELAELSIPDRSQLVGRVIRECGSAYPSVSFVAIKHPQVAAQFRPGADETLEAGDVLIVAGNAMEVRKLRAEAKSLGTAA